MLKTLNELAGPEEVRIEDTGFEWQVLDEDEKGGIAAESETDQVEEDGAARAEEALEQEEDTQVPADEERDDDTASEEDEEIRAGRSSPSMGSATYLHPVQEGAATEAAPAANDEEIALEDAPTDVAAPEDEGIAAKGEAAPTEEEWNELLDEVTEDGADDIPLEVEEELAAIHSELSAKEDSAPVDLDSQFDMQAEAMGLEMSGTHDIAAEADEDEEGITVVATPEEDAAEEDAPEDDEEESAADIAPSDDGPEEDEEEIAAAITPDAEMIELSIEGSDDAPQHAPEYTPADQVPEPSEEEMTINEQIDQELLAIADQDQDLRATIIGLENAEKMFEEDSQEVETIIMAGDVVRGAMRREREKEKRERALKRFDNAGNLIDSYIARRAVRGGRRSTDPLGYGLVAGAAFLVLLLVGQVIHANRESFSTSELFNQTIGQGYRIFGDPVTPEWSITGWQFEATNGSVAEDQDVLTIYSRIGNRSEQPLPYPLVHVSLTDRWEEIIGSRVLEPSEYLAGDLNPGTPVIPGENFTAVITIDEPSVDATGFKLNVCYRVGPGRVRCATEDFKD